MIYWGRREREGGKGGKGRGGREGGGKGGGRGEEGRTPPTQPPAQPLAQELRNPSAQDFHARPAQGGRATVKIQVLFLYNIVVKSYQLLINSDSLIIIDQ